jgi:hypothetical protein
VAPTAAGILDEDDVVTNPSSPVAAELDSLPRWVPPVVFALLTAVVFRAYLLSPAGSMLLGQDTIAAGIMFRSFFVEQYHELHRLPLWNPYLFGGVPTLEAGSGDILYPVAWLHFLLPLTVALAWKLIIHVFFAGVFMYCAARAFGSSRWVALFAGIAYLLGPNLVSLTWGGQDGKMYVITLFPAALWLLVSALKSGSLTRFLWFGVVAGLMVVAHPQLAFYAYLALGIYALAALLAGRKAGIRPTLLRLGGGAAALAVALSVAAVTLLPMYRYLQQESPRAGPGLNYERAASYSLHAEELVNFVVPDFSGVDDSYWGRNPLKHNTEYGGVVVLGLAVAALFALRGDRRRIGLGVMAGVALLYALGDTTPAFKLMYLTLPGLKNFRAPSLATFIALTAVTILACLLLDRLLADRQGREGRLAVRILSGFAVLALAIAIAVNVGGAGVLGSWQAIFGPSPRAQLFEANIPALGLGAMLSALWCGLAAGALQGWRIGAIGPRTALGILIAVSIVDLLRVDARYVEVVRYDDYFPPNQGIETLRGALGPGERVLTVPGVFPTEGHLAVYRIPLVFGYHGNQLRRYDQLTRRAAREGAGTQQELNDYWRSFLTGPVLRMLSARVVILPGRMTLPGYESMGGNEQLGIYRNPNALAGAVIVPKVTVEADSARLLERLWQADFDPAVEALASAPIAGLGPAGGKGSAAIARDGADEVEITTSTDGPALLFVSRNWHPSWEATVDGVRVPVARVDYSLIGIPLSSGGSHRVTLAYRPAVVPLAMRISMLGWAAVALLSLLLRVAARRAPSRA